MITKICQYCNKEFSYNLVRGQGNRKYCSLACQLDRYRKSAKGIATRRRVSLRWTKTEKGKKHNHYYREKWRLKNKERNRIVDKLWREKNREIFNAKSRVRLKLYRLKNPLKVKVMNHKRRVSTRLLTLDTIQQVYEENIKKYGTLTCYLCLNPIDFGKDHLEHKTPISRGGKNNRDNLDVSCQYCNCRKHDKTELEYREVLSNNKIQLSDSSGSTNSYAEVCHY